MRWIPAAVLLFAAASQAQETRPSFRIKYVAEDAVYIEGGRSSGIAEGMKLTVLRAQPGSGQPAEAAALEVISVAASSAVCAIKSAATPLEAGDMAYLSSEDLQKAQMLKAAGTGTHYAQTISFSDGDPLDDEIREYLPKPPLPEVNRFRGRIGFEYTGIRDQSGVGYTSSEYGLVLRADWTRIGGSYWNLRGYTHLLLDSGMSGSQPQTLNNLLNRTYHMVLTYQNPQSPWTMGFGRFYLPWAASLETIDGGYLARHLSKHATVGIFAGTTPDPTSWNYNPNREMAGSFLNFEGGSYDGFKYSSTTGLGMSRLSWRPERDFLFFENAVSWKRYFSIFQNLEVDRWHPTIQQPTASGTSIARSFTTLRFEPSQRISFDLNDNYFHDFPTFSTLLVGTGLLDRILFQGLSGGVRLSLPYHTTVYTDIGRSKGTNDPNPSWNYMYGLTVADILHTGIRGDAHYSRFDSSFGRGNYQSLSLSRQMSESLRLELMGGRQDFVSPLTSQTRALFVNATVDWVFGLHYFVNGAFTVYRGQSQNYNQTILTLGYRF
jgi:hypothetical protein